MSHKAYVSLFALVTALLFTMACGGGNTASMKIPPSHGSNGTSSSSNVSASSSSNVSARANFMNGFAAGIAHASGNYGFTRENYLQEGAERIRQLGSES